MGPLQAGRSRGPHTPIFGLDLGLGRQGQVYTLASAGTSGVTLLLCPVPSELTL